MELTRKMLKIYNTLSGKKEVFKPIIEGQVRMYVCGMTVYDYCHLGHARVMVVFDIVARFLRQAGYEVTYIRNITDIDDKIIRRANENGEEIGELTDRFIEIMHEDSAALGVLEPDEEPRATDSMDKIIAMISTLVEKGFAYQGGNGDVYYDVSKFSGYGKLSGKKIEDLQIGARVEVDESKDDPLDFVLWKSAKPGEPSWPSPWGEGRPGWHIECSAMSTGCLGPHFDIHGGGMDLQFPHHENEIAQSEAATDHPFVNYWMHNGFVKVDEEKMSKSLNNFFTVREVLKQYRAEDVRFFILSSHYRSPLNYTEENLENSKAGLTRLYTSLTGLSPDSDIDMSNQYVNGFFDAMNDDFNTPKANGVLFDLAKEINKNKENNPDTANRLAGILKYLGNSLGLLGEAPDNYLKMSVGQGQKVDGGAGHTTDKEIDDLIAQRERARLDKDWEASDRIRDTLLSAGVVLEDSATGTGWRRK